MTNRLMVDLETLSTRNDAAIVAIGAVVFDESQIIDSKYWPLAMKNLTGHIDPSTLLWWFDQSKEAQRATFGPDNRVRPFQAGGEIAELVKAYQCATVWANDPHFDVVLLENWWRRYREEAARIAPVGVDLEPCIAWPWPFKYNQPRSYRTIVELAKRHGFTDQMYDTAKGTHLAHCAVDDAAAQARVVIACENWLVRMGDVAAENKLVPPLNSWRGGSPC